MQKTNPFFIVIGQTLAGIILGVFFLYLYSSILELFFGGDKEIAMLFLLMAIPYGLFGYLSGALGKVRLFWNVTICYLIGALPTNIFIYYFMDWKWLDKHSVAFSGATLMVSIVMIVVTARNLKWKIASAKH